jgi:hypothetical protein
LARDLLRNLLPKIASIQPNGLPASEKPLMFQSKPETLHECKPEKREALFR